MICLGHGNGILRNVPLLMGRIMMKTLFTLMLVLMLTPFANAADPVFSGTGTPAVDEGNFAIARNEYEKAYKLLLPEAEGGNPAAQTTLGVMYKDGIGCPANFKEATHWLGLASDQGFTRAMIIMGSIYDDGILTPRDVGEALKWYKKVERDQIPISRYNDLFFHKDSDVFMTNVGVAYDPLNIVAQDERRRRINELYEKLNANIKLPHGFRKGLQIAFDIDIDENRNVISITNLGVSSCKWCKDNEDVYDDTLTQAFAAITEGIQKSSPLLELPSWYSNVRTIRVFYPQDNSSALEAEKSFPGYGDGIFVGSIAFGASSVALQYNCGAGSAGCNLSSATVTNGAAPICNSQQIILLEYLNPMRVNARLKSAWQYAREHQSDKISDKEYAAIAEQLRPYLKEYKDIGSCLALSLDPKNEKFLCPLKESRSKEFVLLFFRPSRSCGEGFCDYVISPLRKMTLPVRASGKTYRNQN